MEQCLGRIRVSAVEFAFMMRANAARQWWTTWLEAVSVAMASGLLLALGSRLAQSLDSAASYAAAAMAAVAGYLAADLATGAVHWFCDTFFEEDTPVIGPLIIFPFREHHRDPEGMTRHGFLELTGNSCLALAPVLTAVLWLAPPPGHALAPAVYAFAFVFALAAGATNLFHRWAHEAEAPRLVRAAQGAGLILSPRHHAGHHASPHRTRYCVTNGWANRAVDRIGMFAWMERILIALGLPRGLRS